MSFPHGTVFHPQMAAAAVASSAAGGVVYPGQPQVSHQPQQRAVVSTTTAPMNMMATAPAVAAMGQPTFIYQVRRVIHSIIQAIFKLLGKLKKEYSSYNMHLTV